MTNLLRIGSFPRLATGVHGDPSPQQAVLHAVQRLMYPDDANTVINGYRRSQANMPSLIEDYKRGDLPYHNVTKDDLYYKCFNLTKIKFQQPHRYRPVHFVDLRYYPYPLNSSAEAPYTSDANMRRSVVKLYELGKLPSNRMNFHNLYNYIFVKERQNINLIKLGLKTDYQGNDIYVWNTAHARAHLVTSSDPDKTRMVYGVPKRLIMIETMLLWPLMRHLMEIDGIMLWGYETMKGGWNKLYLYFSDHCPKARTFLALDWKQFDKRARFEVIDDLHC